MLQYRYRRSFQPTIRENPGGGQSPRTLPSTHNTLGGFRASLLHPRWFYLGITLWAGMTLSTLSGAQMVSPTDLFLSPANIQDDFYPAHDYTFGLASVITDTFNATDIGGTLVGVHVLPLLNPNPSPLRTEGEYTQSDLAGITAANSNTYFFRKPGADYDATLTNNQIQINYRAAGAYLVKIDAVGPNGAFSQIYADHVDDFVAEDPANGVKDKSGVARQIPAPTADLVLLSAGDGSDDVFLKNAEAELTRQGKGFVKVSSVADIKKAIEDASKAKGRKISVVLIGHGTGPPQGSIKIGKEYITNVDGYTTPGDFQTMIDPWTSSIEFFSCNLGQDTTFLRDIANSIPTVIAYPDIVTAGAAHGNFFGFFDQGATSKKVVITATPEPGSVSLFAGLSFALLAGVRRRYSRRESLAR